MYSLPDKSEEFCAFHWTPLSVSDQSVYFMSPCSFFFFQIINKNKHYMVIKGMICFKMLIQFTFCLRSGVLVGGSRVTLSWVFSALVQASVLVAVSGSLFHRLFCFHIYEWHGHQASVGWWVINCLSQLVVFAVKTWLYQMPCNHNWWIKCFIGLEVSGMMLTRQHVKYSMKENIPCKPSTPRSTGPDTILLC